MRTKLIFSMTFIALTLLLTCFQSNGQNFKTEEEKFKYYGEQLAISLKQNYQLNEEQFKKAIIIETKTMTNLSKAKKESDPQKKSDLFKKGSEERMKSLKKIMTEEQYSQCYKDQQKRMISVKKE